MANISNGTVFRVPRRENFTIMSNVHLRDPNLTWKARGLMSTILSFPPDWDYTLAGLAKCAKDSIDSTRTGVVELENNGYLYRLQHRKSDGTWAKMEFQVYEDPAQNPYFNNKTNCTTNDKIVTNDKTNTMLNDKTSKNNVGALSHPVLENPTQLNTHQIKNSINLSIRKRMMDCKDCAESTQQVKRQVAGEKSDAR